MAASETELANFALQILGVGESGRIGSLDDDTSNAEAIRNCYHILRRAALRRHNWAFAAGEASLAAHADAPGHRAARAFPLPGDCLRVRMPQRNDSDWRVGQHAGVKAILTSDPAPLEIDYTIDVTDTTLFDALFDVVFACDIALFCCEQITQSNQKKADAAVMRKEALNEAKRTNAIEKVPEEPDEDNWLTRMR